MQKLSDKLNNDLKVDEKPPVIIYDDNDLKIIGDGEKTNMILQKDKMYILPYFLSDNKILIKEDFNIDAYKQRYKASDKIAQIFITVLNTEVGENEKLTDTLRRLLYNDCGMLLSNMLDYNIETLFFNDRNTSVNYLVLLKLNSSQYQMTYTDKKNSENKLHYVDMMYIDDVVFSDIQSKYLVEKLKNDIK